MRKIYLTGILVIAFSQSFLFSDPLVLQPASPQKIIPVTVVVRMFDPTLPAGDRERVPGADIRLVFLVEPVFGPPRSYYFSRVTDSRGECHFAFDIEGIEKLLWACEVVKRFPDGRIFKDLEMPAAGKVAQISEHRDTLRTITLNVMVCDINTKEWPFVAYPFEFPPNPDKEEEPPWVHQEPESLL
jgi:hypothetical protein